MRRSPNERRLRPGILLIAATLREAPNGMGGTTTILPVQVREEDSKNRNRKNIDKEMAKRVATKARERVDKL